MADDSGGQIDTVMHETRVFPPPADFAQRAKIGSPQAYEELWQEAANDIEAFWGKLAAELHWFRPFQKVLDWKEPVASWFVGGQTNVSFNLPRQTSEHAGQRQDGSDLGGGARRLAHADIHRVAPRSLQVCQRAQVVGDRAGDVVSIYMPMVPELAIAMLACARIGAVHSVIFGGFSSEAIADRNNDAKPNCNSLPTTAGAAVSRSRSSRTSTRRCRSRPACRSASCCGGRAGLSR